MGEKQQKD